MVKHSLLFLPAALRCSPHRVTVGRETGQAARHPVVDREPGLFDSGERDAFKTEIDIWLAGRRQTECEAHLMQKQSKCTANGLNPPRHVMRQMFVAFRLWLA